MIYGLKGDPKNAAQIAGYILDRESVENNLKTYEVLRKMSSQKRKEALLKK